MAYSGERLVICKLNWLAACLLIAAMMAACRPAVATPAPATDAPQSTAVPTSAEPTATGTLIPEGDTDAPPTYTYTGVSLDPFDNYGAHVTLAFMGRNSSDQNASLNTDVLI